MKGRPIKTATRIGDIRPHLRKLASMKGRLIDGGDQRRVPGRRHRSRASMKGRPIKAATRRRRERRAFLRPA
jgi:hypothetical protein